MSNLILDLEELGFVYQNDGYPFFKKIYEDYNLSISNNSFLHHLSTDGSYQFVNVFFTMKDTSRTIDFLSMTKYIDVEKQLNPVELAEYIQEKAATFNGFSKIIDNEFKGYDFEERNVTFSDSFGHRRRNGKTDGKLIDFYLEKEIINLVVSSAGFAIIRREDKASKNFNVYCYDVPLWDKDDSQERMTDLLQQAKDCITSFICDFKETVQVIRKPDSIKNDIQWLLFPSKCKFEEY